MSTQTNEHAFETYVEEILLTRAGWVQGSTEEEAVARFVRGIALNAHRFAGAPKELYLSGGLCANPLFVACLPCTAHLLGRFVLLEGLKQLQANES